MRLGLSQRARLLGAIDALNEATGMTLLQMMVKASMTELRDHLAGAGLEMAYREGRSLSLQAIATLALTLLNEIEHAHCANGSAE